jgi:hypothetical protein
VQVIFSNKGFESSKQTTGACEAPGTSHQELISEMDRIVGSGFVSFHGFSVYIQNNARIMTYAPPFSHCYPYRPRRAFAEGATGITPGLLLL